MHKVSYHTEDVAYGMKKVIEFALANDDSELRSLTYKQIEDIGHVIAWELAEVKLKEECQHENVEEMCVDTSVSTCGRCKDCGRTIDVRKR